MRHGVQICSALLDIFIHHSDILFCKCTSMFRKNIAHFLLIFCVPLLSPIGFWRTLFLQAAYCQRTCENYRRGTIKAMGAALRKKLSAQQVQGGSDDKEWFFFSFLNLTKSNSLRKTVTLEHIYIYTKNFLSPKWGCVIHTNFLSLNLHYFMDISPTKRTNMFHYCKYFIIHVTILFINDNLNHCQVFVLAMLL